VSLRRRRGQPLIALLTLLACALPACSGTTGQRRVNLSASNNDCDFKGITAGPFREGDCVARGVAITVVDKAHWLHGREYDARLVRLRTRGRSVTLTLAVRNTLTTPHEFDRRSDLVFLLVDDRYFRESPQLESASTTDPFRTQRGALMPGRATSGTVSFRLPSAQIGHLGSSGSDLVFVNYSDEQKGFPTGSQPLTALGYIRLWK
jgi:hypothetical protein